MAAKITLSPWIPAYRPMRSSRKTDVSDEDQPVAAPNDEAADTSVVGSGPIGAEAEVSVTWRNPSNAQDVDARDGVTALDVLITVNYINARPDDPSLPSVQVVPPLYYDVNGDNACTAHDALLVINFIEMLVKRVGEGEGDVLDPLSSPAVVTRRDSAADDVQAIVGLDGQAGLTVSGLPHDDGMFADGLGRSFVRPFPGGTQAAAIRQESLRARQSEERQRGPVSRMDQPAGQRTLAAKARSARKDAVFALQTDLDAAAAGIENVIDAVAAGWTNRGGDANCTRDGR